MAETTKDNCTFSEIVNTTAQLISEFHSNVSLHNTSNDNPLRNVTPKLSLSSDNLLQIAYKAEYVSLMMVPIGFFLNFICIYVIYHSKDIQPSSRLYILWIGITDNLALIGGIFYTLRTNPQFSFVRFHTLHMASCKIASLVPQLGMLGNGFILACITIERFLCIAFPMKVKSWKLLFVSRMMVLFGILFAGCSGLLSVFYMELKNKTCGGNPKYYGLKKYHTKVYVASLATFNSIIFVFTVIIAMCFLKIRRVRNNLRNNQNSQKEMKVTIMLFLVALLFLLIRSPHFVTFYLLRYYDLTKTMRRNCLVVFHISQALSVINYSVNFFIYLAFSESFRNFLKRKSDFRRQAHLPVDRTEALDKINPKTQEKRKSPHTCESPMFETKSFQN